MSPVRTWRSGRGIAAAIVAFLVVGFAAGVAVVYAQTGLYGINVLLSRGGSFWVSVAEDDARLSPSMRRALQERSVPASAGPFEWRSIGAGFDTAELPVIYEGVAVDQILLARLDPKHFRFVARNAPAGDKDLDDWMQELGAALVINGSYFSSDGTPDTPFVSGGASLGPSEYDARHGAFVVAGGEADIRDLALQDWRSALRGADDAMVSYPLLVAADGSSRAGGDPRWLANRSFVAADSKGRIIFGTTADAFFSLARLGDFLRTAPLDLSTALNLDGGPVACQAIDFGDFTRDFCGEWEIAVRDGELKLLTRGFGSARWALPIVLAAIPR